MQNVRADKFPKELVHLHQIVFGPIEFVNYFGQFSIVHFLFCIHSGDLSSDRPESLGQKPDDLCIEQITRIDRVKKAKCVVTVVKAVDQLN